MACTICLEEVTDDAHELECGHKFHASCLIPWLRQGGMSCPSCRTDLTTECPYPYLAVRARASYLRSTIARRSTAPVALRNLVKRVKNAEQREREARSALRAFKQDNGDLLKLLSRKRTAYFAAVRRAREERYLLGVFQDDTLRLPLLHVTRFA